MPKRMRLKRTPMKRQYVHSILVLLFICQWHILSRRLKPKWRNSTQASSQDCSCQKLWREFRFFSPYKKSNFHVALSKGWGWVLLRLPPSSHLGWDHRLHGTSRELLRGACCVYACLSNNGWGQSCNFGDPMTIANQDQSLLEFLAASLATGHWHGRGYVMRYL